MSSLAWTMMAEQLPYAFPLLPPFGPTLPVGDMAPPPPGLGPAAPPPGLGPPGVFTPKGTRIDKTSTSRNKIALTPKSKGGATPKSNDQTRTRTVSIAEEPEERQVTGEDADEDRFGGAGRKDSTLSQVSENSKGSRKDSQHSNYSRSSAESGYSQTDDDRRDEVPYKIRRSGRARQR